MASSPPPSSSLPPPTKKLKMSSTTASDDEEEDEHHNEAAEAEAPPPRIFSSSEPERRFKRRKVAIFLGYCGAGYQGMQKNPGARTIEGDLEEALLLSGGVPEPHRGNPWRYDWARAARTDKGVSAAFQVVSGRFYVDPPGFVDRLNANLAAQIRAFGYTRVTGSFHAKKFCDRRRESVNASLGSENELAKCVECSERGRKVPGLMGREEKIGVVGDNTAVKEEKHDTGKSTVEDKIGLDPGDLGTGEPNLTPSPSESESTVLPVVSPMEGEAHTGNAGSEIGADAPAPEEVVEAKPASEESNIGDEPTMETIPSKEEEASEAPKVTCGNGEHTAARTSEFRYGEKEKERFNAVLRHYVGTHNFHNFTTRTKAEDPSARRYILSVDASRVVSIDGIDFVRCEVVGQSFMLHQIRKMIGLAVAVMRNCTPESILETAFRKDVNINVPTAPEVGLYLDECIFASYNQKWMDSHEAVSMEAFAEQVEEFKVKYIFSHIAAMEQKEGAVALWLHSLNSRNYPDFHFVEAGGGSNVEEGTRTDDTAVQDLS